MSRADRLELFRMMNELHDLQWRLKRAAAAQPRRRAAERKASFVGPPCPTEIREQVRRDRLDAITACLMAGHTQAATARFFGLSPERVRQILAKHRRRLAHEAPAIFALARLLEVTR